MKLNIVESKVNLEIQGISNFEELEKLAKERAKKIKETVIDEENYKLIQKELDELLDPAKVLRKVAASFKKEGESKINEIYDKIKEVENVIRNAVKDKTEEIEKFIIEDKKRKIEAKKTEVAEILNSMNEEILEMKAPYKTFNIIEFSEDWAIKSILWIKEEMTKLYNEQATTHRACNERLKYADMKSKILKNEYSIENNIDYMQVLGVEIYDLSVEKIDEILESKAQEIQSLEIEQEEKLREKIRLEEENKLKKIEQEKENELKKQQELAEAEKQKAIDEAIAKERKIAEENYKKQREHEEKERQEKERLEKIEQEKQRKLLEEKRIAEEKEAKLKAKKENKYTFSLKIIEASLEQSKLLNKFLKENNISFEKE